MPRPLPSQVVRASEHGGFTALGICSTFKGNVFPRYLPGYPRAAPPAYRSSGELRPALSPLPAPRCPRSARSPGLSSAAQRWGPATQPRLRAEALSPAAAPRPRGGRYPRRAAGPGLRCQMGPCWRPPRSELSILGPPPPRSPPPLRAPPTATAAGGGPAHMVRPAPASPVGGRGKEANAPPQLRYRPGTAPPGGPGACREL